MRKILIVLWLIIAWIPVCSAEEYEDDREYEDVKEYEETRDGLLRKLAETKQDTSRLRVIHQLTGVVKSYPEERAQYADMLLEEAQKQQNNEYICQAYLIYMILAYNMYDVDKANEWMALLEPLARKEELYDLLFQGKQCVIDLLMLKEEYELEEKEAMKMLHEAQQLNNTIGITAAYQCLGYAYQATYRTEKAFGVFEKAWKVSRELNNFSLDSEILWTLIINCRARKDYANWFKYLDIQQNHVKKSLQSQLGVVLKPELMKTYISYLLYYCELENWAEAQKYMDLANQNFSEKYNRSYKLLYYSTKGDYYSEIGRLDKALESIDKELGLLDQVSILEYFNTLIDKSRLLVRAGREEEALQIYKWARNSKDSIRVVVLEKQTDQLKESYEVNALLLEMGTKRQQRHVALLGLFGIVILVLVCFAVHIHRVKQKLERSEHLMWGMKNDMEQANLIKERFLSNINMTIRPSLDAIVGSSFQLTEEKDVEPSEKERLSGIIDETSKELMALINDILLLSKLEAGMLRYNMASVEIVEVINGLVAKNGVKTVDVPENIGYETEADMNYFIQVIESLLKAQNDENGEIILTLEELPNSSQLSIRVAHVGLAAPQPSQVIVIRNEINRMLIEHFGGQYQVVEDAIVITLSATKSTKSA